MLNGIMPKVTAFNAVTWNDSAGVEIFLGGILIATIFITRPTVGMEHDCYDHETRTWCDEDECVSPVPYFEDDLLIEVKTHSRREDGFGITVE